MLAAERLHGDDTTVPILAKGKQSRGAYGPMSATTDLSAGGRRRLRFTTPRATGGMSIRHGIFTASAGILQADAYSGYNALYDPSRPQGPITSAFCWAHARRQFFELADIAANARRGNNAAAISPIALEAVKRIDALFDIERGISGLCAEERLRVRQEQSAPLLAELEAWLREQRDRLSRSASLPSQSTTCSSVGIASRASSTTAGSA